MAGTRIVKVGCVSAMASRVFRGSNAANTCTVHPCAKSDIYV